jgi:hypothetical protein
LIVGVAACGDSENGQTAPWDLDESFDVEENLPDENNATTPSNNATTPANNATTPANNATTPPVEECESDDDCSLGDACVDDAGLRLCQPAIGAADGEACDSGAECQGGACIGQFPGGYCTSTPCTDFTDCARLGNENRCLQNPRGDNFCVRICTSDDDCREGYACETFGGDAEGVCFPGTRFDPSVFDNQAVQLTCQQSGDQTQISYTIDASTVHYMITPIHREGGQIQPVNANFPDGTQANFRRDEQFLAAGSQLYGFMNPTLMPGTLSRASHVQAGTNTYTLRNEPGEMCYYLLEEDTAGTKIDFNIYLVGVPGLDASSAPSDADMQEVIDKFDFIFAPLGYTVGEVRYIDVTGEDRDRFRILRSEQDVSALVSLSEVPGNSLDDALSANVFFVEALALGGAIGISPGLPGPAAIHGTQGSGVVFTSEFLGNRIRDSFTGERVSGNDYTGIVFAHEVGHYLGLYHTSEQNGFTFDPLPDTPECNRISANCPDVNNLMFPFAGITHTEVTPEQGFVVGANPLTKEATP